ncbi:DUF445 domain-containing protein [Parageobacillus thermoglucosidasius]|uniref:DUF445 domain-containing protein n=1 Tax=Parageobacillus thermoglucosidasius TaxID=1426 RepID=UPI000B56CE4B|nr:DUF445 domain-containing protein [Parageobacillus thermoglucosidasius]MBY6268873.1 DUF445 domain-containing protein [Parageobacillus thermoglucosidasius]MED4905560.1 DUF445 domain-containing protein [Parageobacillus thermoglucosidasius]MED4915985.1 DUF445 domain-containing protein [Parageobacillus thermoglucosidasius]MED4947062.1 DUF445 domain-containing protein [Parageobacillus thermoglucosidasius]MED4981252.1 DUF445 domain-containing protein [Parageobacillus thermoglucosidasius]
MISKKSKQPKKSKRLASFSLAVMGAGFVATIPFQGSHLGNLLQGGFEAGLVGGLADWFAVTALFRHPLGVPIPHTALLPKNRQRITKALVSTLENDWLSKESIRNKIKQIHLTEKLLSVLEKEIYSDSVKRGAVSLIAQMIGYIPVEKVAPFVEKEIKSSVRSMEINAVLPFAIDQVLIREYDEKSFDYLLDKAEEWIKERDTKNQLGNLAIRVLDNIELDGFLRFALKSFQNLLNEEKLGSILQNLLLSVVSNLRQKDDPNRKALLLHVRKELQNIKDNKELLGEIENWKDHLIDRWEPAEKITEILQRAQQKALAFVQDGKFTDTYLLPFLTRLLNDLQKNPEKLHIIENWIQKQIIHLVEENHSKIGQLVQENLDKLDNETLIHMMENKIGTDLQWIRVNGAVCGFIIGILLTEIKALI